LLSRDEPLIDAINEILKQKQISVDTKHHEILLHKLA